MSVGYTVRSGSRIYQLWRNMISSSGLFVTEFPFFSDTTFLNCLHPSACLTKTVKAVSLTQSLHNHLKCKHTAHLAVKGGLFLEDINLVKLWCFQKHCYVSISYITLCLLCWGDLFGKVIDVGKLYSYP